MSCMGEGEERGRRGGGEEGGRREGGEEKGRGGRREWCMDVKEQYPHFTPPC